MKMRSTLLNTLLLLMMASVAFLMSCNKDDDDDLEAPIADFTFSVDGGTVTFTNASTGDEVTYSWDFGDGTTSTQESPVKTYTDAGTFSVTLTVTNDAGSDSNTQDVNTDAGAVDEEAPVITLEGDAEVSIEIGSEYTDAGATANDNVDGDISDDIEVTGEVNTLQPGEYTLTYEVEDAAGNAATEVTRTVTVTYDEGLLTNGDFEDGATGWTVNFGDPQVPEIQEDGGNKFFFANVESAGDAFIVNLSQVLEIGNGNTYKLSFNASTGENNTRDIIAGIGLNEEPFTNVSESITLSDQTQRFELEFTANFGSTNSRILFDMGAEVGIVVIDNVSLELTEEAEESTTALPLDFESDDQIFEVFNGASFALAADPENGANQVGKVTNVGAAFEGISLDLGTDVDFSSDKQITIQFNTSQSGVPVLLKFENGSAGDVETTATASTTGWQELTFDFSSASGSYSTITLFVDGPGTTSGDFYVDDITQTSGAGGGENAPSNAAPTPTTPSGSVVASIFSDAYTSLTLDALSTTWDDADASIITIDGNETIKVTPANFWAIAINSVSQNLTSATHMRFDYYIPEDFAAGMVLNPKLSNHAEGVENNSLIYTNAIAGDGTGQWVTFDVALSNFVEGAAGTGVAKNNIAELLWTDSGTISEYYIDNIYFYTEE